MFCVQGLEGKWSKSRVRSLLVHQHTADYKSVMGSRLNAITWVSGPTPRQVSDGRFGGRGGHTSVHAALHNVLKRNMGPLSAVTSE